MDEELKEAIKKLNRKFDEGNRRILDKISKEIVEMQRVKVEKIPEKIEVKMEHE